MLIGVLAEGESASAEQLADGLSSANDLINSWSAGEQLVIPQIVREEFTLVSSTGSYTIGASGTFNTTRPISIEEAKIEDQSASPTAEYPLEIINIKSRADIVSKDLQSTFPTQLYVEWANPLAILYLWPVPTAANKLVLYSKKPLTAIAASTSITLPPGYDKALRYNLAIDLAPEYGKTISQEVAKGASDSLANIKRNNIKPMYLQCDSALVNKQFNILTGGY